MQNIADLRSGKCKQINKTIGQWPQMHGTVYSLSLDNTNGTDVWVSANSVSHALLLHGLRANKVRCIGAGCGETWHKTHVRCNAPTGGGVCRITIAFVTFIPDETSSIVGAYSGHTEVDTTYSFTIANNTNFIPALTISGGSFDR